MTLFGLQSTGILPAQTVIELVGFERRSLAEARHADELIVRDEDHYREIYRRIEKCLVAVGIDCIVYSNQAEPPNNTPRDAYFVLHPEQVISAITRRSLD
jgi:hypothetical protein